VIFSQISQFVNDQAFFFDKLNKHDKDYEVEKLFISQMKSLSRVDQPEQRLELFKSFRSKLDELLLIDRENVILEYFDLRAWIESKIEASSFADTVKQITIAR